MLSYTIKWCFVTPWLYLEHSYTVSTVAGTNRDIYYYADQRSWSTAPLYSVYTTHRPTHPTFMLNKTHASNYKYLHKVRLLVLE